MGLDAVHSCVGLVVAGCLRRRSMRLLASSNRVCVCQLRFATVWLACAGFRSRWRRLPCLSAASGWVQVGVGLVLFGGEFG
jgi:hypothetical protein